MSGFLKKIEFLLKFSWTIQKEWHVSRANPSVLKKLWVTLIVIKGLLRRARKIRLGYLNFAQARADPPKNMRQEDWEWLVDFVQFDVFKVFPWLVFFVDF